MSNSVSDFFIGNCRQPQPPAPFVPCEDLESPLVTEERRSLCEQGCEYGMVPSDSATARTVSSGWEQIMAEHSYRTDVRNNFGRFSEERLTAYWPTKALRLLPCGSLVPGAL